MRQLLVNLTRLGDLLQMQPVIWGLKAQGHEVGLICLENFSGAAGLLNGLDWVSPLPGASLLAGVRQSWPGALCRVQSFAAQQQRDFAAQRVINFTASGGARLLTRLLCLPQVQQGGFGLDEMGFGQSGNAWATYVQAATLHRGSSPFNLVDGFRAMAGVAGQRPDFALKKPDVDVRGLLPGQSCRGYVALQMGASEEHRRWPVRYFAQVAKRLWQEAGYVPLLLGSAAEGELSREFAGLAGAVPFADLCGKTSLEQLAGVLCASRLLISNDTGTMHLAAGLGVPVLALFLATAQPWDTGPYVEDSCALEPDLPCHPCAFGETCGRGQECRLAIEPGLVAELALNRLHSGLWQATGQGARVWIAGRRQDDCCGFLDLRPLHAHAAWARDDRIAWIRRQRNFYRHFLDELCGEAWAGPGLVYDGPELSAAMRQRLAVPLEQTSALAGLLARQAGLLQGACGPETGRAFLQGSRRLSEILAQRRELCVLAQVWKTALQDLGGELAALGNFLQILHRHSRLLLADLGKS